MKLFRFFTFILILLVFPRPATAQLPAHFSLGENELNGIDIYDILQDKNGFYWLATNSGLIKYNGYSFTNIPAPSNRTSSLFDLKTDYSGNIYCKNLSGQLFKIEKDICKEFFRLPDSLVTSQMWYNFDNKNQLVILSKSFFTVNKQKRINTIRKDSYENSNLSVLNDSTLQITSINSDSILYFKDKKLSIEYLINTPKNYFITSFYMNNNLVYYDKHSNVLLKKRGHSFTEDKSFYHKKKELLRFYSDNQNLWVAKNSGGVLCFDKNFSPLYQNKVLFKNQIISAVLKDKEGNILLGTFGNGIIVIPNIHLIDISFPETETKITKICKATDSTIFAGTQSGKVYKINKNLSVNLIDNSQTKNIEVLEFLPETNEILIDGKANIFINIKSKKKRFANIGAIKDFVKLKNGKYIFAANIGIGYIYPKLKEGKKFELIPQFSIRTNCVDIDTTTNTIYAGTSLGLKIKTKKTTVFYTIDNKTIKASDILFFNHKIYITTKENGVLIFENNKLIKKWQSGKELISDFQKQIKPFNGNLIISGNKGLQVISQTGKNIAIMNGSEGVYSNNILDFEVTKDELWIVNPNGLQKINTAILQVNKYIPNISFANIFVNDSVVKNQTENVFTYKQNRMKFNVNASSIKYKNEIKYFYELKGIDNKIQINKYQDNEIEYKSLPAGTYTFNITAICRKQKSKTISYKFKIKPPLWETWWFFTVFSILGSSSLVLFFRIRIKRIKYRSKLEKQLKISEITAIKAQMNPHFIFNAINSIQDLILKGDIENSYSYIIKFSQMVRRTLSYSDKEFIDLEDEIQLLEIYLKLEKLRFKEEFSYVLTNKCNDEIMVPPMLIQPFVENAIKHGLLHQEGIKKLVIEFEMRDVLHCTVSDNGIGRKKSKQIKERQQTNYKSFSTNATENRFEIMKIHYKTNVGITYFDLSPGTKVEIKLPFKQKF